MNRALCLIWALACSPSPASPDTGWPDTGAADGGDGGGDGAGGDGAGGDGAGGDGGGADGGDGGGGDGRDGGDGGDGGSETDPWSLSETGPLGSTQDSGALATASGCTLNWTRWTPSGEVRGRALLAHGFVRSSAQMADHAALLASHGVESITMDLCWSGAFNMDPPANAADLIELADHLGPEARVYVGHSNGAMAALLAAHDDPKASGAVGLDPVEAMGQDSPGAVAGMGLPTFAALGETAMCNAENSGALAYGVSTTARALRITEADHCDFESPTDGACTAFCGGSNNSFDDAEITLAVRGLMVGAVLTALEDAPEGQAWWTSGGGPYDQLMSSGALSSP